MELNRELLAKSGIENCLDLYEAGNYGKALICFKAKFKTTKNPAILGYIISCYIELKSYEELSVYLFELLIELEFVDYIYKNINHFLLQIFEEEEIISQIQAIITKTRFSTEEEYAALIRFCMYTERFTSALVLNRELLEISPHSFFPHLTMGVILTELGQPEEGLILAKKAIRMSPKSSQAYVNLGKIYISLNKIVKGIRNYKKAIKLDSKNISALDNLGLILYHESEYQEALKYFIKSYKINPYDPNSISLLAYTYEELGDFYKTYYYFSKLLTYYPNDTLILQKLDTYEDYKNSIDHPQDKSMLSSEMILGYGFFAVTFGLIFGVIVFHRIFNLDGLLSGLLGVFITSIFIALFVYLDKVTNN